MRRLTRLTGALLALLLVFSVLSGCGGAAPDVPSCTAAPAADAVTAADAPVGCRSGRRFPGRVGQVPPPAALDEGGEYTSAEDVALYLHLYAHLPQNFITKKDARALGWNGGGLDDYADGKCIGGDRFGNYEGLLPDAPGRSTMSVISTHCTPSRAGRSASYTPMTGLSIIPRITTRALYCFYGEE